MDLQLSLLRLPFYILLNNILLFPPSSSKSRDKVKECACCRVSLLELVLAQLQEEGSECGVAPGVALFLADSFQTNCGAVLKLSAESCVSDDEVLRVPGWGFFSFQPSTYYSSACH